MSCQTGWKTDYENVIEKSEEDFSLLKQVDTLEKDSNRYITVYSYGSNEVSKLQVNSNKHNMYNNQTEYYKNDSLIFMQKVIERNPIHYTRPREEQEPVGEIIERITYFKNSNYGIEKSRRVQFHLEDDIHDELNKRSEELQKVDFETKEIGEQEYVDIQQKYERYSRY